MFAKGQRVELHPACDDWMRGDRFGEVVGYGRKRQYCSGGPAGRHTITTPACTNCTFTRPVRIRLDKSGRVKRFHPEHISVVS